MLRTLTIAACLALGVSAAHAADATTEVNYSDLDLSKPSDARTLAARLRDAASAVCLKANPVNVSAAALEKCVNLSVRMAMTRLQSEMDEAVSGKISNVRTAMRD